MSLEGLSISISINENNTLDKSDMYISYQLINALRHESKFVIYSDFLREKGEKKRKKEMNCVEY
jgi:hypothetical protein